MCSLSLGRIRCSKRLKMIFDRWEDKGQILQVGSDLGKNQLSDDQAQEPVSIMALKRQKSDKNYLQEDQRA